MLALRNLRNCLKSIKLVPLRGGIDLGVSVKLNAKLDYGPTFISYRHSTIGARKALEFLIPRRRDSANNRDVANTNWKITKLCREGKIYEARELFDVMPERDVVSWTALISGYIKCGQVKEAREVFDRADAKKDVVTWTVMLSGLLKNDTILEAERFFKEIPYKNVFAKNTMIDGYIKNGMIEKALELFEKMEERNVVSWNMMISGLANCGRVDDGLKLFDQMNVKNVVSWTDMVSGLSNNSRVDKARLLFDKMPERNVISWNAMITGYSRNMRLGEAYDLFEIMPEKSIETWNTMIAGFIKNDDLSKARKLFDDMPEKNVISWTSMMSGHVEYGESEEAFKMFYTMKRDFSVKPNRGTFVTVLKACSVLAGVTQGMQVHQAISKTTYHEDEHIVSALISMYSKCGELAMAQKFFDNGLKRQRDLVSWNSMIAACAHHGHGREAIMLFEEMQSLGFSFKPNDVTYVSLLSACSHAGLVEQGLHYFESLLKDLKARDEHFACVVDLYVRAGRLEEAFSFIEEHSLKASPHSWGTLLFGCNLHGNGKIGRLASNKINSANHSTYSRPSNQRDMTESLKKQPGCSWIEVGNKFHVFVVGHRSDTALLHPLLFDLHRRMKMVGFEVGGQPHQL